MWFTEVGWSSTRQGVPGYEFGQGQHRGGQRGSTSPLAGAGQHRGALRHHVFVWNLNFRTGWARRTRGTASASSIPAGARYQRTPAWGTTCATAGGLPSRSAGLGSAARRAVARRAEGVAHGIDRRRVLQAGQVAQVLAPPATARIRRRITLALRVLGSSAGEDDPPRAQGPSEHAARRAGHLVGRAAPRRAQPGAARRYRRRPRPSARGARRRRRLRPRAGWPAPPPPPRAGPTRLPATLIVSSERPWMYQKPSSSTSAQSPWTHTSGMRDQYASR